jgi:hypothetical protein
MSPNDLSYLGTKLEQLKLCLKYVNIKFYFLGLLQSGKRQSLLEESFEAPRLKRWQPLASTLAAATRT